MSVKIMSMVFERYPNGGGEMLLALALADHSHDDGTRIYPSIKQLAAKTRQSERTVQYQLRKMEDSGWLILDNHGNGGRNLHREYSINAAWIKGAEIAPFIKGANGDTKGAIHDTKGATDDIKGATAIAPASNHQEPSRTVIESSADPKAQGLQPLAESADPVVLVFPLNDKTGYGLRQSQVEQFAELYPAVDILGQLRACLGWNIANEGRRKTRKGILKHINTWLAEKQDKARAPAWPDRRAAGAGINAQGHRTDDNLAAYEMLFGKKSPEVIDV